MSTPRPFRRLTSAYHVLNAENVDTDQIIPARFLTTTARTGLGAHAFHDWRYHRDGSPRREFFLNHPWAAEARILVAGRNFGCGSSREHAVWALLDTGIDVVVSPRLADIFRDNALANGLLPVEVTGDVHADLLAGADRSYEVALTIDLATQQVTLPDGRSASFPITPFARHRLLEGIDEMDFLLQTDVEIAAYETSTCDRAPYSTFPGARRDG